MTILLVVDNPKRWPLHIQDVEVVAARRYITEPAFMKIKKARVFNLSRSYRYQSTGYYVSLLADARGHKPIPDVSAIRDLQTPGLVRLASSDLNSQIQKNLADIKGDSFTLSIYFGQNLARRYKKLAMDLFNLFRAPLLRAEFVRNQNQWTLASIAPISVSGVPENHRDFLVAVATEYFKGGHRRKRTREPHPFSLAILASDSDPTPPSNKRALEKFIDAADRHHMDAQMIGKDDLSRLTEYDALFIRETTSVTNHTFRFARRAQAEGLVVIDDPQSILRCTNKVYLEELLHRHRVTTPRCLIVHKDNIDQAGIDIGFPLILKQPDSSYSLGVKKVSDSEELKQVASEMLAGSELLIAQEFIPTEFDWRIGVIDGQVFYACKYYMAKKHWQIVEHKQGGMNEGRVESIHLADVPQAVLDAAVKSSGLIGNGLYGIDIKEVGKKCYVIEVNDNPSLDAGFEDCKSRNHVYDTIMKSFLRRIKARSKDKDSDD
jgi:glutathione synthase/RimK-type ligase-like ATP-grasp enzyme